MISLKTQEKCNFQNVKWSMYVFTILAENQNQYLVCMNVDIAGYLKGQT